MLKARSTIISRRTLLLIAFILSFSIFAASCGSSSQKGTSQTVAPQVSVNQNKDVQLSFSESLGFGGVESEVPAATFTSGDGTQKSGINLTDQRKIIMEGNVSIETKDFDASIKALDQLIEDVGGFAESRTVRGTGIRSRSLRDANFVIRVPSEKFNYVMNGMGSVGTVLEANSRGTDITDQYMDYEARVKALKIQEETLLELMEKSTKLEDVIALESRISEVRYEIEKIENNLKNYDRLIAYSRISVYIQEVDDTTETEPVAKTLNERITNAFNMSIKEFRRNLENFLVWLAASWISLIFLLIITIVLLIIIRKSKVKRPSAPSQKEPEVKAEKKEEDGKN
ncbi:MAG: DUF4349 domain-containing protein [Clostridiaceae bacterium]|nr:DUF4349 domain-containing protein [Clostridiaceae bacterium]